MFRLTLAVLLVEAVWGAAREHVLGESQLAPEEGRRAFVRREHTADKAVKLSPEVEGEDAALVTSQESPVYVGCFRDTPDRDLPIYRGAGKSYAECQALCSNYVYFSRQANHQCFCGDSFGKHGYSSGCSCWGGYHGSWKQCVWKLQNSYGKDLVYFGCYRDTWHRDLPYWKGTTSFGTCKARCANYPYFGLQAGNECRCGYTVGRYGGSGACKCTASFKGHWANCVYKTPGCRRRTRRRTLCPWGLRQLSWLEVSEGEQGGQQLAIGDGESSDGEGTTAALMEAMDLENDSGDATADALLDGLAQQGCFADAYSGDEVIESIQGLLSAPEGTGQLMEHSDEANDSHKVREQVRQSSLWKKLSSEGHLAQLSRKLGSMSKYGEKASNALQAACSRRRARRRLRCECPVDRRRARRRTRRRTRRRSSLEALLQTGTGNLTQLHSEEEKKPEAMASMLRMAARSFASKSKSAVGWDVRRRVSCPMTRRRSRRRTRRRGRRRRSMMVHRRRRHRRRFIEIPDGGSVDGSPAYLEIGTIVSLTSYSTKLGCRVATASKILCDISNAQFEQKPADMQFTVVDCKYRRVCLRNVANGKYCGWDHQGYLRCYYSSKPAQTHLREEQQGQKWDSLRGGFFSFKKGDNSKYCVANAQKLIQCNGASFTTAGLFTIKTHDASSSR